MLRLGLPNQIHHIAIGEIHKERIRVEVNDISEFINIGVIEDKELRRA